VIDEGRWSYDVLESYQESFLDPLASFRERACEEIADGHRHVYERQTERDRKRQARD
jgi:hypothetical protein